MTALAALSTWLIRVLPAPIAFALAQHASDASPLHPDEEPLAHAMSPSRRDEFRLGRSCVRNALAKLGAPDTAILRAPGGAPLFPTDFVGSLSHTHNLCIAIAATRATRPALGVDVETRSPTHARAQTRIATPGERHHLADLASEVPEVDWWKLLFSAKESVYKAHASLDGTKLRFHDVEIEFAPHGPTFSASMQTRTETQSDAYTAGYFWVHAPFVATVFEFLPGEA